MIIGIHLFSPPEAAIKNAEFLQPVVLQRLYSHYPLDVLGTAIFALNCADNQAAAIARRAVGDDLRAYVCDRPGRDANKKAQPAAQP